MVFARFQLGRCVAIEVCGCVHGSSLVTRLLNRDPGVAFAARDTGPVALHENDVAFEHRTLEHGGRREAEHPLY
jgi:hypothetical protein